MSSQNETDLFRKARSEGRDLEDLQREAQAARPSHLGVETSWEEGLSGSTARGVDSSVIRPSPAELESYGSPGGETCGSCKAFDLEKGRQKIIDERFAERLVHDEQWQLRHLCVPPDHIGLCGQSGGEMAVTVISKACDHYRPLTSKAGRFRLGRG